MRSAWVIMIVFEGGKAVISGVTDVEEIQALVAWMCAQLSACSGGTPGSDGSKVGLFGLDAKQIDSCASRSRGWQAIAVGAECGVALR